MAVDPQNLHPSTPQRHQRHQRRFQPYQSTATRPQPTNTNPRVRVTHLPLFQLRQVPHHHRHVPGKVTALVMRAILLTTALARMCVLTASVLFALGRGVEGQALLLSRRALNPLTTGSGSVYRVAWRNGCLPP